jgi:hypothetical protein
MPAPALMMARLACAGLAVLASAELALAQAEAAGKARLELSADTICIRAADLMARVRARSPRVRFVTEADAISVRVRVRELDGRVRGELTLGNREQQAMSRKVVARSCSEAADAMALIIAVTLDPTALTAGAAPAAQQSDSSDSAGPAATAPTAPPEAAPPAAEDASTPSESPATPSEKTMSSSPNRARLGLQLAFQTFVGPAPDLMPGVALYALAGIEREQLWSPSVMLGATHVSRGGFDAPGGTARFSLDAASLDACPIRWRSSRLELRPCASVLVGRLAAEGTNTLNSAGQVGRPFWLTGGAGIVTFAFATYVEASARVAVGANLVRDSFVFTPAVFHAVPAVTLAANAGVGVRWR